jgi:hypothetical protein
MGQAVGEGLDLLPNSAGPVQRQMAADYAARRARLFNAPSPTPKQIVRSRPLSPFDPRRVEREIEEAVAAAVATHEPVPDPPWKVVLHETSRKYGVPVSVILGDSRARWILPARFEAAYRMVHELGMSLPAVGRRLNRDHTSVLHAIKRHVQAHPELQPAIDAKVAEQKSVRASIEEEILRLYFAEGKSVKFISEELCVSRPMVHGLIHREVMRVREARRAA